MQKIINAPQQAVDDMLEGFTAAHAGTIARTANPRVLKYRQAPIAGKVGVVTGGGSGHKPAFIGYLGRGLLDAVAVGEIFTSPPAQMFHDAFKAAQAGRGVACLFGNYSGDLMNVRLATEMAAEEGIEVRTVIANDDVPSAPRERRQDRRGVAGEVLMWKIGGAKAAMGASLEEVAAAGQKAIDNTRSMGIGLAPCTIPEVGHPNFNIEPGKMEVGIGHHGEPGLEVMELESSARMARRMTEVVLPDLPFRPGDETAVLLSGLGSTPLLELYILYGDIQRIFREKGLAIHRSYVGNYFTSLEMAGVTLTVLRLDGELKECLDYEADSPGFRQFRKA